MRTAKYCLIVFFGLLASMERPAFGQAAPAAKTQEKSKAAEKKKAALKRAYVKPTESDVAYGSHPRQVVDFFKAPSDKPTPVVLFIHGGGWVNGDKTGVQNALDLAKLARNGISVVSVQYRMVPDAQSNGVKPPVKWPLEDARRALQFVRSKAKDWNVDKSRIVAHGTSAGACSSLWLAMHDEMADAASADPVARESSRLAGVVVSGAQTNLDPKSNREWVRNMTCGGHTFGFRKDKGGAEEFQRFYDGREQILAWIREYSPIEHVSKDDPPMILLFTGDKKVVKGEPQADPTHSPLLGKMLQEKAEPLGVKVVVSYPAEPVEKYRQPTESLITLIGETR